MATIVKVKETKRKGEKDPRRRLRVNVVKEKRSVGFPPAAVNFYDLHVHEPHRSSSSLCLSLPLPFSLVVRSRSSLAHP